MDNYQEHLKQTDKCKQTSSVQTFQYMFFLSWSKGAISKHATPSTAYAWVQAIASSKLCVHVHDQYYNDIDVYGHNYNDFAILQIKLDDQ
jgi:hypothetical protein